MNIYVVVEGEIATKKIYRSWIPLVNIKLTNVDYLENVIQDNFFILAGFGQPYILERVDKAINDVNKLTKFDRLVIGLDSEEDTYEEKYRQVKDHVGKTACRVEVRYIIQHFCLETWLLGNKSVIRKQPQDVELLQYKKIYDVRYLDPENLIAPDRLHLKRAHFAYKYLRAGIRDLTNNRATYSKRNPGMAKTPGYYAELKKRHDEDNHIKSFGDFINAFS